MGGKPTRGREREMVDPNIIILIHVYTTTRMYMLRAGACNLVVLAHALDVFKTLIFRYY